MLQYAYSTNATSTNCVKHPPQLRAGAKGYGLFAKEAIRAGQFIIEYVGEVLEEEEYQKRKDFYLASGTRHYYFMNIGNGEVIDACRKVPGMWLLAVPCVAGVAHDAGVDSRACRATRSGQRAHLHHRNQPHQPP